MQAPLHCGLVLKNITVASGHGQPAMLALNGSHGTFEFQILACCDAILEDMVALINPSLT